MAATVKTTAPAATAISDAVKTLLGLDKAALAEATKTNPELETIVNQLKDQIAEEGSPRNVAVVKGLTGDTSVLTDWMEVKKGASTYLGVNAKIADRSFAARFVVPAKKAEDAVIAGKIKELSVKVALFAAEEAKKMGLTSI